MGSLSFSASLATDRYVDPPAAGKVDITSRGGLIKRKILNPFFITLVKGSTHFSLGHEPEKKQQLKSSTLVSATLSHSFGLRSLSQSMGLFFPSRGAEEKQYEGGGMKTIFFSVLRVTLSPFSNNRMPHFHRAQKFQTRAQPGEKEMKTGVVGPRVFRERTPHHIFSGEEF